MGKLRQVDKEGQKFVISRKAALMSGLIKANIDGQRWVKEFPLKDVSRDTLHSVVEYLTQPFRSSLTQCECKGTGKVHVKECRWCTDPIFKYAHNSHGNPGSYMLTTAQGPPRASPPQYMYAPQRQQMGAMIVQNEETYCGPMSLALSCIIPCGCWICLCPIDKRAATTIVQR